MRSSYENLFLCRTLEAPLYAHIDSDPRRSTLVRLLNSQMGRHLVSIIGALLSYRYGVFLAQLLHSRWCVPSGAQRP